MQIDCCQACNGPAAIHYQQDRKKKLYTVWIQCELCGARTRDFRDRQEPNLNTIGGKFAAIAWNSGDQQTGG